MKKFLISLILLCGATALPAKATLYKVTMTGDMSASLRPVFWNLEMTVDSAAVNADPSFALERSRYISAGVLTISSTSDMSGQTWIEKFAVNGLFDAIKISSSGDAIDQLYFTSSLTRLGGDLTALPGAQSLAIAIASKMTDVLFPGPAGTGTTAIGFWRDYPISDVLQEGGELRSASSSITATLARMSVTKISDVPLPSTGLLFSCALIGLMARRRAALGVHRNI